MNISQKELNIHETYSVKHFSNASILILFNSLILCDKAHEMRVVWIQSTLCRFNPELLKNPRRLRIYYLANNSLYTFVDKPNKQPGLFQVLSFALRDQLNMHTQISRTTCTRRTGILDIHMYVYVYKERQSDLRMHGLRVIKGQVCPHNY